MTLEIYQLSDRVCTKNETDEKRTDVGSKFRSFHRIDRNIVYATREGDFVVVY